MCSEKAVNLFVGRSTDNHEFWLHVCESCTEHLKDNAKKYEVKKP